MCVVKPLWLLYERLPRLVAVEMAAQMWAQGVAPLLFMCYKSSPLELSLYTLS